MYYHLAFWVLVVSLSACTTQTDPWKLEAKLPVDAVMSYSR